MRWSLAQQFPWLEVAWARAYLSLFAPAVQNLNAIPNVANVLPDARTWNITPSPIESWSGALNPSQARQVVTAFVTLLQQPVQPAQTQMQQAQPAEPAQTQMQPSVMLGSVTRERASWVTHGLLETLLPAEAFDVWAEEGRDAPRMRRTRSVLRRAAPFVALVRNDREYVRLVNRAVLLEEIAASLGEEPESSRA